MKTYDLQKIRADFPMLSKSMHGKPLIYFDNAATTQKPLVVIETVKDFYTNYYGTVHRAIYDLSVHATAAYQQVREEVRALLNAEKVEEIIFTKGTTEAINLVASSFGKAFIKAGDEILISEVEHHSNIVPWQMLCEERGAQLKTIPVNDLGVLDLVAYRKLLSPKTRLVSIAHISNVLGTVNPIKEIVSLAHTKGAKVLIDGAQAASHMPVDVQDLNADFYVFSGHKFYGPTGIGVLYGKAELLNALPPYQGGGDMINAVTFERTTYADLPLKFEAGTPLIAEVLGLGAAIRYVKEIGFESIKKQEHLLLEKATALLKQIEGLKIIGEAPQKAALISFHVENAHPLDIATLLDLKGIAVRTGHLCSQPAMHRFGVSAVCRASFSFYNTEEEVAFFASALKDAIKSLRA